MFMVKTFSLFKKSFNTEKDYGIKASFFVKLSFVLVSVLFLNFIQAKNLEEAEKAIWKFSISSANDSGTVFFISKNHIVTNFHVLRIANSIEDIRLTQAGSSEVLKIKKILKVSGTDDLALLEIKGEVSHYLSLSNGEPSGDLFIYGYPWGAFRRMFHNQEYGVFDNNYSGYIFAVDHTELSGASGSPVLNRDGEVVGVLTSSFSNNMAVMTGSNKLEELKNEGLSLDSLESFFLIHCIKKEMENLEEKAIKGDVVAQYRLGIYYYGDGLEQNLEQAFQWLQKAATQGYTNAQSLLGLMYYYGDGVEKNFEKAFQWTQKAATQGHTNAQYNLGIMFLNGKGVEKNFEKAFQWLQKAATQGHADATKLLKIKKKKGVLHSLEKIYWEISQRFQKIVAQAAQEYAEVQYDLGRMYYYGDGLEQNFEKAFQWLQKAATQGLAKAQYLLGRMYLKGEGVEKNLEKALESLEKAATQGLPMAQYLLGRYLEEKNPEEALEWLEKVAEQGLAEAQYDLGIIYYDGQGVEQNLGLAFEWTQKAAEQGHADAQNNLGELYYHGNGVEQNWVKSFEWTQKAAEQGLAKAQYNLGTIYFNGEGVEKNSAKAFQWFQKAAEQGHAEAQNLLGLMYYYGEGVEQNLGLAFEWTQKAAEQGHAEAQNFLGIMKKE